MVKIVEYGGTNGDHIIVPSHDLVIGRGFLKCDDKRVSRNHGLIKTEIAAGELLVYIKSLHPTNPIFYRQNEDVNDSILRKDENVLLETGGKFKLTPDGSWFIVKELEQTEESDVQESRDLAANTNDGEDTMAQLSTSTNEVVTLKRKHQHTDSSTGECSKRLRNGFEDEISSTSQTATNSSSSLPTVQEPPASNDAVDMPKIKTEPGENASSSTSVPNGMVIKPDPDQETAPTSTLTVKVKPDPEDGAVAAIPAVVVCRPADHGALRPSCDFGIRCYRGGQDHRTAYAHPGDNDYRRPDFPPAPPDSPLCPYGARCYRRNPAHFREYQHPDPNARILGRLRRHVPQPHNPIGHDIYSDDEFENPDFDGTSSDEYEPGRYDDDDYYTESEDEGIGCVGRDF